jgi:hypothetical protein
LLVTCAAILSLAFSGEVLSAGTAVPKIWFSLGGQGKPPESNKSWDILFYQPDAPWPEFMNHVQTVGMLTQVLERISDANLAKIVARLKEKHVALGVEMLAQAYTLPGVDAPARCGGGVEGYAAPAETAAIAAKLKRAGATLQYIAMDEPLWFGHYYRGKKCLSFLDREGRRPRRGERARVPESISGCRDWRRRAVSVHHGAARLAERLPDVVADFQNRGPQAGVIH